MAGERNSNGGGKGEKIGHAAPSLSDGFEKKKGQRVRENLACGKE